MEQRLGQGRRVLRGLRPELLGLRRGRKRGPRGPHLQARLLERRRPRDRPGPRRGCALAHARILFPQLPRLRHGRLREDQSGLRYQCRLRPAPDRSASPRHPDHRGLRREPHRVRPSVVRRFRFRPLLAPARLVRLEPGGCGRGPTAAPPQCARVTSPAARRRPRLRNRVRSPHATWQPDPQCGKWRPDPASRRAPAPGPRSIPRSPRGPPTSARDRR
jgi:hypothetical protein